MIDSGELFFTLSVGDEHEDIVRDETAFSMTIVEEVGGYLPQAQLSISLPELILDAIVEGDPIKVTYGANSDLAIDTVWFVRGYVRDAQYINAILTPENSFTIDRSTKSEEGTSVDILKKIGEKYFKIVNGAGAFNDKMKWINPNLTMRDYLTSTMFNSFSEKGDMLFYGITADERMIIKNLNSVDYKLSLANDEGGDLSVRTDLRHRNSVSARSSSAKYMRPVRGLLRTTDSTHKNYINAGIENKRLVKRMLSDRIHLLINDEFGVNLLDGLSLEGFSETMSDQRVIVRKESIIALNRLDLRVTLSKDPGVANV